MNSTTLEKLPPLIPRDMLFGNPEKIAPKISPDGTMFAYLAPSDGMLSVWVTTIGKSDDRVVARDPARPISLMAWRGDSRHVLYLQDRAGDENHHVFQVDVAGGAPRELTPGERLKANIIALDHRFPDEILISQNLRDESVFDVYRLDLGSGESQLDTQNPGDVAGWLNDNAFVVRAAVVQNEDGTSLIRIRDDAASPWRTLDEFSFEDGPGSPVAFSPDDRSLYVISSKGANAARLVCYDLASGAVEALVADSMYDVAGAYVDPATNVLVAAAISRERIEWRVLDADFAPAFAALAMLHPGDFTIEGASADGQTLIVRYSVDTGPTAYYVYDRADAKGTLLFYSRPALLDHALAPMQPIVFRARDGMDIHGYLTLPVALEPRNLPAVMFVHGGPWHRDRWGYDPWIQWLANPASQLSRLDRLRQSVSERRKSRMGRCDAHRLARRARLGGGARLRRSRALRDHGRELRRVRRARGAHVYARCVYLRRRYRRAVESQHATGLDSAVLENVAGHIHAADG